MKLNKTIEHVLTNYPEARDSDKYLILKVWEAYGLYLSESQKDKFMGCPSTESIRRTRQKLQEQGKYRASERVSRHRRIKSYIVQQNAPTATPERLGTIVERPLQGRLV